jgi:hypothetical protein
LRLAATAPETAILEAYQRIDEVTERLGDALGMVITDPSLVLPDLLKRGYIDRATIDLFETLEKARNIVAFVPRQLITTAEALDFGEQTDRLVGRLYYALGRLDAVKSKRPAASG